MRSLSAVSLLAGPMVLVGYAIGNLVAEWRHRPLPTADPDPDSHNPDRELLALPSRRAIEDVPDFAATVYHALGLNPQTELRTLDDRPMLALPEGNVIKELV